MKSISTLFRQLFLIVAILFTFSLSAWGEEVTATLTFDNTNKRTSFSTSKQVWEQNGITFTNDKSSSTSNVANYVAPVRLYASSKITIEAPGNITKIVFDCNSGSYATALKNSIGTVSGATVSVSSDKVTVTFTSSVESFTVAKLTAQVRMDAITVTYTTSSGDCTKPEISFAINEIKKINGDNSFTNTLTTNSSGEVTYTSSATNVATVNNNGQVTINGVGTTTITATVAAYDTYCEATAEYKLTVEGRTFNITWMNGTDTHAETTYTEGQPLTLPAQNPESCSDNYSTFVGWYTEQAGTTSEPSTELSGTEASKTTINSNTTFYAVFGDGEIPSSGTESIDFSTKGYANGDEISSVDIAEGINITFNQGTNSNTPKYYTTGTAVRVYGGGYFVVSSTFGAITKIVLTFGTDDGNNGITTDYDTYSDGTWTGSSQSVKFTIGGTSGNRRIKAISVTTESGTTATGYISTCEGEDIPAIYAIYDAIDFESIVENENSTKSTTITTVNLKESASVSISGTNASCFAVNTNTIEDNSETEITIIFTAPDVDLETKCTATLTITGGGQTKEIALTATVKPLLTLTANINGIPQEVGTFAEGDDITTALNAIDVTAPEGWSFAGWVANAIDGSQTATPEYLTIMPAEATIAYAVFKLGKEVNKEFSFSITENDFNSNSYADNNNEKTSIATSPDNTTTEVKWTSYQVYKNSGMQWQKNSGSIYNSTDLGTITNIAITSSEGTFTTYKGTSKQPTSAGEGGYFQIKVGGATGKTSKVTITFEKSASSYTYRTSITSREVTSSENINEDINSLTIYSNATTTGEVIAEADINVDVVTLVKTIGQTWCFFSLPFDCNVAGVVATAGGTTLKYAPDEKNGDYVIAEYKGGWKELLGTNHTLNANQGYIIGQFTDNTEVTVKFPSNGAQTILAPANATITKISDKGFNLIGLPYYQTANANLNVEHVSIPKSDGKTYNQVKCDADVIASITPFSSFFVQTENDIQFTIGAQQNAAPMMRANGITNEAVITLTDANGGADRTTIINDPSKTTDYEIGHDLTKLIGYASIPQIYSLQGEEMLAFNSLAIDNSTVIPLGVYAHADGEYTFALNEKSVGDLSGWELYDNETGSTTRLAYEDLTIYLEQGTHEGRFEIRLQQRITTDCDNTMGDMMTWTANGTLNISNMPIDAVVYIYDAVGRMVHVTTPNTNTFNYDFVARGVYNIVVRTADNTVSFKTIY